MLIPLVSSWREGAQSVTEGVPSEAALKAAAGDPKLLSRLRNSMKTPWEELLSHPSLQRTRHAAPCCRLLAAPGTTTAAWSQWLACLELLIPQTTDVFQGARVGMIP